MNPDIYLYLQFLSMYSEIKNRLSSLPIVPIVFCMISKLGGKRGPRGGRHTKLLTK